MFNIGSGEFALIAVVALLVLGPKRLPELARGIGKFLREFRRQTDEVRGVVEREFYKMDSEMSIHEDPLAVLPAVGSEPIGSADSALPETTDEAHHSQLTSGASPALPATETSAENGALTSATVAAGSSFEATAVSSSQPADVSPAEPLQGSPTSPPEEHGS
jgi:sec-independent protein translocase protein TatB